MFESPLFEGGAAMKRCLPLAAAGAMIVAACSETSTPTAPTPAPTPAFLAVQGEQHIHVMLPKPHPGASARLKTRGTGIFYHGGPIFYTTNVAAIYWSAATIYNGGPVPGTRGGGAQDGSLVGFFLRNLGGSPYFNINTTYFDGTGTHVQNSVSYTQFWADGNGPSGTVSDAQVQQEVVRGFTSGALTYDPSTLYAVFSGPGVNLGGGFGTQYCAYHGHFSSSVGDVKYAVMPYDWSDPAGCSAITGSGPNGDPAADTEVNKLAHETEETSTRSFAGSAAPGASLSSRAPRRVSASRRSCPDSFSARSSSFRKADTESGATPLDRASWSR